MKHKEADFGILFRHWMRANGKKFLSCSFEIKDTRGQVAISFKEIKDDQLLYGMAIKGPSGALIRVMGSSGEPDYVFYRNSPAYFVIKFPESFSIIDVETLMLEKSRSKRKSLTQDRAKDISIKTVKL